MKSPSQQGALAGPLFLLLPIAIAVVHAHATPSCAWSRHCKYKIDVGLLLEDFFFEPLFVVLVWIIIHFSCAAP